MRSRRKLYGPRPSKLDRGVEHTAESESFARYYFTLGFRPAHPELLEQLALHCRLAGLRNLRCYLLSPKITKHLDDCRTKPCVVVVRVRIDLNLPLINLP